MQLSGRASTCGGCGSGKHMASALPFFADGRTKPKPAPEIVNLPKFTWDEISAVRNFVQRKGEGSVKYGHYIGLLC